MKITKPSGKPVQAPVEAKQATKSKASKYALPTAKAAPVNSLSNMAYLIYGEKKIGKTSFAAQFPNPLFLAFEKGFSGLSIFVEEMFGKDERPSWPKFVSFIDLLIKEDHEFTTIVIDTADKAYDACLEFVCEGLDINHPSDLGYGKGWKAVSKEFVDQIDRLVNCKKFGVVFISHAVEKEFVERTGGKFDKIISSIAEQGRKALGAVCDCIVFYGYHGEERLLTIRGSDSVESGTRMKYHFWVEGGEIRHQELAKKKREIVSSDKPDEDALRKIEEEMSTLRIHSIPAGADEEEAYFNFERAFYNKQKTNGKPKFDFGNLEKKAPMSKGK